ncbi:TPA: hypothetical protein ACH3X1_015074 [Trebouxia sp. C0004]
MDLTSNSAESEAATSSAVEAADVKEFGIDQGETYSSVPEGMTSEGANTQEDSSSDDEVTLWTVQHMC